MTVGRAPLSLVRAALDGISAAMRGAPAGTAVTQGYDYGARYAVRELGAADMTRNHTQTQDIWKYSQIIEGRALSTVFYFLQSRGVDTSDYRQQATNIINAGAVHLGAGDVTVQGSSIGQQNQFRPPSSEGLGEGKL